MKNKKILISVGVIVIAIVGIFLAMPKSACQDKDAIVIENYKAEIDEPLTKLGEQYEELTGTPVCVKTVSGDYQAGLKADFNSGNEPDIFVLKDENDAEQWMDILADMSGDEWVDQTEYEMVIDGQVVGQPMVIEGFGLIVNNEKLNNIGWDYTDIQTPEDLFACIEDLNANKEEAEIEAVFSSTTMEAWSSGDHRTVALLAGAGEEDAKAYYAGDPVPISDELEDFAQLIHYELQYSVGDPSTTDYDTQIANFAQGKAAFMPQGNWVQPLLVDAGMDVSNVYMVPEMFNEESSGNLTVGVSLYWAVNETSDKAEEAQDFLNWMATSAEGQQYFVDSMMVSPFDETGEYTDGMSQSILDHVANGTTTELYVKYQPQGFNLEVLAPIYDQYAKDDDADAFVQNFMNAAPTAEDYPDSPGAKGYE